MSCSDMRRDFTTTRRYWKHLKSHDAERARDVMEQHLGGSIETLKMSGKIEDREGGTGKKLSNGKTGCRLQRKKGP